MSDWDVVLLSNGIPILSAATYYWWEWNRLDRIGLRAWKKYVKRKLATGGQNG